MRFLLRANVVTTVDTPPLRDGGILIEDGRIAAVDRWRALEALADASRLPIVDHRHR